MKLNFIVHSLEFSVDNMIIYAVNKKGQSAFWQIQSQTDSIRLNFAGLDANNAYITPNKEYFMMS